MFHMNGEKEKIIKFNNTCLNGKTYFSVNVDYLEDFMRHYKQDGFFGVMHLKHYTHDSNDNLGYLDDLFLDFLHRFESDKSLSENTILMLYSDHGARFSNVRESIKGLLQERNPFFSIYLPPLFEQRYKTEIDNLRQNQNKLIAPMDIHATMEHLIGLEMGKSVEPTTEQVHRDRGISLFRKIASDRTCEDAGITTHWCGCLKRTELKINSDLVKLADHFVNLVNKDILKEQSALCHTLELDRVIKVYSLNSEIDIKANNVLTLAEKRRIKKFFLMEPTKIKFDFRKYFFQVQLKPGAAIFEFTIIVEQNLKNSTQILFIETKEISRINKYGNDSICIFDNYPDLRKFCFCK